MGETFSLLFQDDQKTYQNATHQTTGANSKCEGVS